MTFDGAVYSATPLNVYAGSIKYQAWETYPQLFLDFNQDGILDGLGYKGMLHIVVKQRPCC